MAAASAGMALILSACAPTQQAVPVRPVNQADDERASLMRVAAMTRQAGDLDTAMALYRRVHELDRKDPRPLVEMARMLDGAGAYDESIKVWQDAVRVGPGDATALGGYGVALARVGEPRLAQNYLQKSIAAEPSTASYNALGVVLDQLGDAADAQAAYRDGLAMAPDDISLSNNLALSLALSGKVDEAQKMLEQVVLRPEANARHRQNLSLVYALAGQEALSAEFGRIDFEPAEAERNVMRYASIASLPDHATRVSAVGALRGAQAARATPDASIQSAALVKEREAGPKSQPRAGKVAKAESRVTPVLDATPPASPQQTASTAPATSAPIPLVKPTRSSADVAASTRKNEAVPRKPLVIPDSVTAVTKAPAKPDAEVAAVVPTATASTPANRADDVAPVTAKRQVYRSAFTPAPELPVAASPARDDGREMPSTLKSPERAATANVGKPRDGTAGSSSISLAATSPAPMKPADTKAAATETTGQAGPIAATPTLAEIVTPPIEKKAAAKTSTADAVPFSYPLAMAGIEVPPVEDRLIVAASAYHAEAYQFAASIWQPLADAGVDRALFHLGALYYEGRGVERDLTKAYKLLRQAEMAGFADARIVLALVETKLSKAERNTVEAQLAAAQ